MAADSREVAAVISQRPALARQRLLFRVVYDVHTVWETDASPLLPLDIPRTSVAPIISERWRC